MSVAGSPTEIERLLEGKRDAGFGARMTAGYCWPWSDPGADGRLVPDVAIGGWSRPWNLEGEHALGGAATAAAKDGDCSSLCAATRVADRC